MNCHRGIQKEKKNREGERVFEEAETTFPALFSGREIYDRKQTSWRMVENYASFHIFSSTTWTTRRTAKISNGCQDEASIDSRIDSMENFSSLDSSSVNRRLQLKRMNCASTRRDSFVIITSQCGSLRLISIYSIGSMLMRHDDR